jgi:hypothetical protein
MVNIGGPGVRAAALGLILGLVLSAGALRAMRSELYGVGVYDAPTVLSVVLILASVTLIAGTVPTLRIARIDPAQTLREEWDYAASIPEPETIYRRLPVAEWLANRG